MRDHPRIRGEHSNWSILASYGQGSSPHTRGARSAAGRSGRRSGIIPAYAGSTIAGVLITGVLPDHPRIRGEHPAGRLRKIRVRGSSPHTRGAHGDAAGGRHRLGIIPAYAGSTGSPTTPNTCSADHPRIRGEHGAAEALTNVLDGSSPHTRGAPRRRPARLRRPGIIPAYAGSTS